MGALTGYGWSCGADVYGAEQQRLKAARERPMDNTAFPSGLEWFTITRADGSETKGAQCARCGSSVVPLPCDTCGGDGEVVDDRDWNLGGLGDLVMDCRACNGAGEHLICSSGSEWCEEHPLPGRENVIGA